ncbi:MAG TPA: GGDEF domain-containing protein, partial [Lachnospiraceae bacterium]|nr:GGDEF domain-containing protein [Lachnospiraceae bacterium]
ESATYDNTEHMIRVLEEIRNRGFKISMDDFGTGYSSLSLLTEMPIDTLKIDKSFVDKIGFENEREEDVMVIRLIISLARELGFVCLAEGAERKEQIDRLRSLGCDVVQGYYYSRPIPMEEFDEKYLKRA